MSETLRAVADLIDAHPDLPLPYVTVYDHIPHKANVSWYLHINQRSEDEAHQKAQAQAIIKALSGKWAKRFDGTTADFEQERDGLNLQVSVTREAVCERVVTGTKTVTIPGKPAEPERVEQREVVEWRCEPVLAEAIA